MTARPSRRVSTPPNTGIATSEVVACCLVVLSSASSWCTSEESVLSMDHGMNEEWFDDKEVDGGRVRELRRVLEIWCGLGATEAEANELWEGIAGIEKTKNEKFAFTPLRHLMVCLYSAMLKPHRMWAWDATVVYMRMLSIPGASAYGVFHPMLYGKVLHGIRQWCRQRVAFQPINCPSSAQTTSSSVGTQSIRTRKPDSALDEDNIDMEDSDLIEEPDLDRGIIACDSYCISILIDLLGGSINLTQLCVCDDLLPQLSEVLVRVIVIGKLENNNDLKNSSVGALVGLTTATSISSVPYVVLEVLLPVILMNENNDCVPHRPHDQNLAHNIALQVALSISSSLSESVTHHGEVEEDPTAAVFVLLQHLCFKVPERSDARNRIAGAVALLAQCLPIRTLNKCIIFLGKLASSKRPSHRNFAVMVSIRLLKGPWIWEEGYSDLFSLVIGRCNDKIATVRGKATSALCDILEYIESQPDEVSTNLKRNMLESCTVVHACKKDTPVTPSPSQTATTPAIDILRMLMKDDKAVVRKNATSAMGSLLLLLQNHMEGFVIESSDLHLLSERCSDTSIFTRKEAMAVLTNLLLANPSLDTMKTIWVRSLLPLANDPELSCQVKLADMVRLAICDRVISWYQAKDYKSSCVVVNNITEETIRNFNEFSSVWSLVDCICGPEAQACLKKAIGRMLKANSTFKPRLLLEALRGAALLTLPHSEYENEGSKTQMKAEADNTTPESEQLRSGCWKLLEAFVDHTPPAGTQRIQFPDMDTKFVVHYWNSSKASTDPKLMKNASHVLRVISRISPYFSEEEKVKLMKDLKHKVLRLDVEPDAAGCLVSALFELSMKKNTGVLSDNDTPEVRIMLFHRRTYLTYSPTSQESTKWVSILLEHCEKILEEYVKGGSGEIGATKKVEKALFLVGEAVLVGFSPDGTGSMKRSSLSSPASSSLVKLVQILLPPQLPLKADSMGQQVIPIPGKIRALAFVTLGKLCLHDQTLAKQSINILLRELREAESAAVRNNCLIVLGDLCVRYTGLVDRHIGAISVTMQDLDAMVRRNTLLIFTQLLVQDYVKFRGFLLYRFLACIADPNENVAAFAKQVLMGPLLRRWPNLFVQHIVEAVVVLNGFSEHPVYTAVGANGAESITEDSMDGVHLTAQDRIVVYEAMLEQLSDEQRIQVAGKLAQDIMGAAVDGALPVVCSPDKVISEETRLKAESILRDAFLIMRNPRLRIGSEAATVRAGDEDLMDVNTNEEAAGELRAAKSKLLKNMSRKHLIENVVPVVVSLKHILEKGLSPLLRDLMIYLRDLMRAFKTEVSIVLAHAPTLDAEIKYDLALFEKADAERRKRRKPSMVSISAVSIDGGGAPPSATRRASTGSSIAMSSQAIRYGSKHHDGEGGSQIHHSNIRRRSVDSAIRSVKTPLAIAKAPGQTPSVVKTVTESSKKHHGVGLTPAQSLHAVVGGDTSSPPTTYQRVTICSPYASDISAPKWNVSVTLRSKDVEKENSTSPPCITTTLEKRGSVQVGTAKVQDVKRPRRSRRLVNKAM